MIYPLRGISKIIRRAPIKTGLPIPYLVKGTANFLPDDLIFRSSRDLPLEGEKFAPRHCTPIKTILPIPYLVRGYIGKMIVTKKFSKT